MQALQDERLRWHETATVTYIAPLAPPLPSWLRCAFTTRHAGRSGQQLNLSFNRGIHHEVLERRQQILQAMGLDGMPLCIVRQVHGNQVCVVDAEAMRAGWTSVEGDALVTTLPQVMLGVLVADCLPLVLYALQTPMVAVIHAGRMGTYHRIVTQVLKVMVERFGVAPAQVHAILGPAIGGCCYTLDLRAVRPFQERFPDWETFFTPCGVERWTMSLTAANTLQLREAGVPAAHIVTASPCTVCHNAHLFSHRAEGPGAGRGMALAAIVPTALAI
jgi:YfiH family protein